MGFGLVESGVEGAERFVFGVVEAFEGVLGYRIL